MTYTRNAVAVFLVIICCLLFATDSIILRVINVGQDWVECALRSLGATIVVSILCRRVPKLRFRVKFICAPIFVALANFCFISSLTFISVGAGLLLFYTSILWSVIVSRFISRPVSRLDFITAVLVFTGLVVFMLGSLRSLSFVGLTLGLASGLFFSCFLVFLQKEAIDLIETDQWVFVDGFLYGQIILFVVPFLIMLGFSDSLPRTGDCLILLVDGGFCYGLGYYFVFKAIKHFPAHLVNAFIGAGEPIAGVVLAATLLGEEIRLEVAIGMAIIIFGILLRAYIIYRQERNST